MARNKRRKKRVLVSGDTAGDISVPSSESDCRCPQILDPLSRFLPEESHWSELLLHFCPVCNIQLNSCQQSCFHVGGKKHQKRLKYFQIIAQSHGSHQSGPEVGVRKPQQVGTCEPQSRSPVPRAAICNPRLEAAMPACFPAGYYNYLAHKAAQLAPLDFSSNSSSSSGVGWSLQSTSTTSEHCNHQETEVQTRSSLSRIRPKVEFHCEVCDVTLKSEFTKETHLSGSKHARKVQAAETSKKYTEPDANTEPGILIERIKSCDGGSFHCEVCDIDLNSILQVDSHVSGAKHKFLKEGKTWKEKSKRRKPA